VSGLSAGVSRFGRDDGSAEPRVAAALAAFAAGQGSEHAAVTSLARSRLLVPIVAVAAGGAGTGQIAGGAGTGQIAGGAGTGHATGGEHASEMSVPTLIGADGRSAIPAFTCMDALRSWRPQARPVPTAAQDVWRAAVADGCGAVSRSPWTPAPARAALPVRRAAPAT